ncbi:MAG: D-glycero-D-manno-heptose 1,7-bisphosphate phosphatase [Chthoniobacter sp.]|nr:D-glycero-D-manno-heptose 1,7-bisphosphate phosphatase [Chthoniobacter sp.]
MEDVDYCNDPRDVCVYEGVTEALTKLRDAGFENIIITNQAGIARGRITSEQYESVHAALLDKLGPSLIRAVYFCPDFGPRRKPSPEMVFEAARDFDLDLARSFFVGDKAIDVECGRNAGVRAILVQTGYGVTQTDCGADFVAKDLAAAADYILENARA